MPRTRCVMIGGFLGAGKTTAMMKFARRLTDQGLRVGLITNDQSVNLVDTARVHAAGFPVQEITGGCFCCKFESLVQAAHALTASSAPDVVIAEPVGSCTDLQATVNYPMRLLHGDHYEIAPLSVMVDPIRCAQVLGLESSQDFTEKVLYIYGKQLEEADHIVINKIDLLDATHRERLVAAVQARFPRARIFTVSCKTGEGFTPWFDAVLSGKLGEQPTMSVDYDIYADGEALMGWLNTTATLSAAAPFDGHEFLMTLATSLRDSLAERGAEIAHLKMTLAPSEGMGLAAVSLTRTCETPHTTRALKTAVSRGELTINLRAEADPEILRRVVNEVLSRATPMSAVFGQINAFRPGRPTPTHRMASSIA